MKKMTNKFYQGAVTRQFFFGDSQKGGHSLNIFLRKGFVCITIIPEMQRTIRRPNARLKDYFVVSFQVQSYL